MKGLATKSFLIIRCRNSARVIAGGMVVAGTFARGRMRTEYFQIAVVDRCHEDKSATKNRSGW